ncbi:type II toxin-antitoxin system VapC family toxin [Halorubrum vacuolatum]|uniref:Predicted nucleic acid-binding protein, contains PIN domain n=1 Tax=Halorubrum vacuolatum TaxID=63740 RepID=A0A238V9S2_HALVU|nr:type II toxin-antitoxin system VapC family toxin [Halorubrum vacuolatum]SNR31150.1 Predicted nucleic acid-binding protein, contains PIN domain [Halorubrum vacuolatum]
MSDDANGEPGRTPVFDTSSLIAVLLDDDTPPISVLFDGHVLDLTIYEAGNVLWKIHTLQGRTTQQEHAELISLLADLRRELVVHDLEEIGVDTVMRVATATDLTFYDAGYLACAEMVETTLVTEDSELSAVANGRVRSKRVRNVDVFTDNNNK